MWRSSATPQMLLLIVIMWMVLCSKECNSHSESDYSCQSQLGTADSLCGNYRQD